MFPHASIQILIGKFCLLRGLGCCITEKRHHKNILSSDLIFLFSWFACASQNWTSVFLNINEITWLFTSSDPLKTKHNLLLCCASSCWKSRTSADVHHTLEE